MALSTQATVTGYELAKGSTNANIWIVDTEAAALAVETAGACAVRVFVSDGTTEFPVHEKWTASRGTPNWNDVPLKVVDGKGTTLATSTVYLAFSPLASSKAKTEQFFKEVSGELEALGAPVKEITIPAGLTLEQIAMKDGEAYTEEHLLARIEEAIEVKVGAKQASVTVGDGAKDIMYDIANGDFNFQQSMQGEPFITSKSGVSHVVIPFNELNHYLVREYKNRYKTIATQKDLKSAIGTVEADCAVAPKAVLGVRTVTSPSTGVQWIDLGREDGKVVKLTAEGWAVKSAPDADVFFQRTGAIQELPIPTHCPADKTFQMLEAARRFANIPDAQWPLVVGWMVTHLINDSDHLTPLIFFLGGAQSGKTTISVLTRFLTEGIIDKGSDAGSREGDLQLTMSMERIKTLNNISSVPEELSELLCQVYEGLKITSRKMYSSETVTLDINCSVIANGVTVGRMKEDLKTRVMSLDVDPKHGGTPWKGGKAEASKSIDDEMRRIHPDALGALLTLAALSLEHHDDFYESVNVEIFRLKGFATVLRTLDMVWSLDGQTVNEYKSLMDVMSEEATEDPMFECIRSLAVKRDNFNHEKQTWVLEIDLTTLKLRLNEHSWAKAIDAAQSGRKQMHFATSNSVRDAITRKSTDWKRMGVTYENLGRKRVTGSGNKQTFFKFTFQKSDDTAWSQLPSMIQTNTI